MAAPKARLVTRVEYEEGRVLVTVKEPQNGATDTVGLDSLDRMTLIRAALNVAQGKDRNPWNQWSVEQLRSYVIERVSAEGYEPTEWTPKGGSGGKVHSEWSKGERVGAGQVTGQVTHSAEGTRTESILSASSAESALIDAIRGIAGGAVNEATVRTIVNETLDSSLGDRISKAVEHLAPRVLVVQQRDREEVRIEGTVHKDAPELIATLLDGDNVFLAGGPGTGKTTLAETAAKALGVPLYSISCSPDMMTSRLIGFNDAAGVYRGTDFRKAWDIDGIGGVFLLDEMDNATGSILAMFNQGLANGVVSFPDGPVKRHPECYVIGAANTFGTGPTAQFVGRQTLDPATLDRFYTMEIGIDEELERTLILSTGLDQARAVKLHDDVKRYRRNIDSASLRVFVTPRFSVRVAKAMLRGMDQATAEMRAGFVRVPADQVAKIRK